MGVLEYIHVLKGTRYSVYMLLLTLSNYFLVSARLMIYHTNMTGRNVIHFNE